MRPSRQTTFLLLLSLAALSVLPGAAAGDATLRNEPVRQWEIVHQQKSTRHVLNEDTGKMVAVEGVETISVPVATANEPEVRAGCSKNEFLGEPYVYWSGGAHAASYASVSLSSGCTGYVYWTHYLERRNMLDAWVKASYTTEWTDPGETDSHTLMWTCATTNTDDWRARWTEVPTTTAVKYLSCSN